ncbi:MAG: hypothetical protein WC508_05235 [Patescibacteria group bacterium]
MNRIFVQTSAHTKGWLSAFQAMAIEFAKLGNEVIYNYRENDPGASVLQTYQVSTTCYALSAEAVAAHKKLFPDSISTGKVKNNAANVRVHSDKIGLPIDRLALTTRLAFIETGANAFLFFYGYIDVTAVMTYILLGNFAAKKPVVLFGWPQERIEEIIRLVTPKPAMPAWFAAFGTIKSGEEPDDDYFKQEAVKTVAFLQKTPADFPSRHQQPSNAPGQALTV